MSLLREKVLYHALKQKHGFHDYLDTNLELVPVEGGVDSSDVIKNVCAKMHISVSDRIDSVVDYLGMSKRQFIEAAVLQALDEASGIIRSLNADEVLEVSK